MQPQLFIVVRPSLDVGEFGRFLKTLDVTWRRTHDASPLEEIVEAAGRVCYLSFGENQSPRSTRDYIHNLLVRGHESVLEHVTWGFVLAGVSRAFSHQLVRHRVGFSFSQLSQQYHEERGASPVVPQAIMDVPKLRGRWQDAVDAASRAYGDILDELERALPQPADPKTKQEHLRELRSAARSVLPEATRTMIFFTANARALRHFLDVRGSIVGDAEMRAVSVLLVRALADEAPSLFDDFVIETAEDGREIVHRRRIETVSD